MIVILTSNYDGGIIQLAEQIEKTFNDLGYQTKVFVPSLVTSIKSNWTSYERRVSMFPVASIYREVAKQIESENPELVFVCDSNIVTSRIVNEINRDITIVMCMHDVSTHVTYRAITTRVKVLLSMMFIKRAWKKSSRIILLSQNSYDKFQRRYPYFSRKASIIKLGAHVPDAEEAVPKEMNGCKEYILFFGRLDQYKGINRLLRAYNQCAEQLKTPLVIAGRGVLTEEEQKLIDYGNVILIKRYITDSEMIWLFKNALYTVLPYIESSQSGVLSISYFFKKPVIVSNIAGLTEFVEDGVTGFIFNSENELIESMFTAKEKCLEMQNDINDYYMRNLDWSNNINGFLKDVFK